MAKHKKSAYELLIEFPRDLSLYAKRSADTDDLVKSVIGTQDLVITANAYEPYETRSLLLEIRPEAAALLAEISRVRSQEYAESRYTDSRLPIALHLADASHFGIRATPLADETYEETELCLEPEKALLLKEKEVDPCDSFQLELDYDGMISIMGEEPYNTCFKAYLTAYMLQQMAEWQPDERAGMSPA